MMRKRSQSRECALQILYLVNVSGQELEDALEDYWIVQKQGKVSEEVQKFAVHLVKGALKHKDELDKMIAAYAENWGLHRMATIDLNVLRLACFELLHCDEIPPKVTMNEAIELSKRFGDEESGKFVNGILDSISRNETKPDKATLLPPTE